MRIGLPRRLLDLGPRCPGPRIGNVVRQRAVEQDRLLLHDGDLAAQRRLPELGNVLAIDGHRPAVDVIEPLDELDEGGLARARMTHQPHAFARLDRYREILVERRAVRAILEGHVVERDCTIADDNVLGPRLVFDAQRLVVERHQLFHVVDRALQVAHVLADIAQMPLQHEEHGQNERDVARRGDALQPQPQAGAQNARLHHRHHDALQPAIERAAGPHAPRAHAPLAHHPGHGLLFARFRAKRLDHGIAAHRVGQRPAHAGVPHIGQCPGRRDIIGRDIDGNGHIDDRAEPHHQPHHRPGQAQDDRRGDQHQQRWPQRDQQRVIHQVQRAAAAGNLAHGGAGKAVGVPVGRKPLHPVKGIGDDLVHDAQGEPDDVHPHALAQQHRGEIERRHGQERCKRLVPHRIAGRTGRAGHRIHQPAGKDRGQRFGQRCTQHQPCNQGGPKRLASPMGKGKAEHLAKGIGAKNGF